MIKTIIFDDEITPESVTELIDKLEQGVAEEMDIHLYFCSEGGITVYADILLEKLEDYRDNILLIGFQRLASAAFGVFYKYTGDKKVMKYTSGMVHKATATFDSIELSKPHSLQSIQKEGLDDYIEDTEALYAEILTLRELELYQQGEDVAINHHRMTALFNN